MESKEILEKILEEAPIVIPAYSHPYIIEAIKLGKSQAILSIVNTLNTRISVLQNDLKNHDSPRRKSQLRILIAENERILNFIGNNF